MRVTTPPATHTAINIHSLSTLPATMDGARKMPIPTTRPTIIVTASKTVSCAWGCAVVRVVMRFVPVGYGLRDGLEGSSQWISRRPQAPGTTLLGQCANRKVQRFMARGSGNEGEFPGWLPLHLRTAAHQRCLYFLSTGPDSLHPSGC